MQKQVQNNKVVGIIPARLASTRFPGKPLVEINGKSMIQRVYEQCCKTDLDTTIVATDDQRIKDHIESFGGNAMMTKSTHQTGTDRCAEIAANLHEAEVILNVQGDEPFINPNDINKVIRLLIDQKYQIATLSKKIIQDEEVTNPNIVKVVFSKSGQALYFSRSTIPYVRNNLKMGDDQKQKLAPTYYRHIGLYGFQKNTLLEIAKLPQSNLETAESLEQLRWLENGYRIGIDVTDSESISVDTPEDLQRIIQNLKS